MHEADRLVRAAAAGPGDAGDGDDKIDIGGPERAARHGFGGLPLTAPFVFNVSAGTPSISRLASLE